MDAFFDPDNSSDYDQDSLHMTLEDIIALHTQVAAVQQIVDADVQRRLQITAHGVRQMIDLALKPKPKWCPRFLWKRIVDRVLEIREHPPEHVHQGEQ
jgi:hypothetical protein